MRKLLLDSWLFEKEDNSSFEGQDVYGNGEIRLLTITSPLIYSERIDEKIESTFASGPELLIFASRHSSEAKKNSLTVHPTGNYSLAKFGGQDGKLSVLAPLAMAAMLRSLKEGNRPKGYAISYEATHHGPLLNAPSLFIEVGSDEAAWQDVVAVRSVVEAIMGYTYKLERAQGNKVLIGFGGGHYCPRFTDIVLSKKACFGHMAPAHSLDFVDDKMVMQMAKKSGGAKHAYLHKKAMPKPEIRRIKDILLTLGIEPVDSSGLEDL